MNLIGRGGADVLMCSTAYGGSCQLADIFEGFTTQFRKHEFHIQDKGTSVVAGIQAQLAKLADRPDLLPTTVIFLEAPTNPDMKVPDLGDLVSMIQLYKRASGREVMLLVDATFAPGSKVMQKLRDLDEDLIVMCFISLSKSVSRGLTTGGALIANHTPAAKEILGGVADACQMLDLIAKPDQLMRLVDNHGRTEERCQQAYALAVEVGEKLYESVRQTTGYDMPLAFVTPEEAAMGFTTGTISFNLPCRPGASPKQNEALAQQFVDALCVHSKLFKPCVSFGQDNGLVYCPVPATSTQGAVKAEDKEKQAVGGVQLCRLSFPATCDVEAVGRIISDSVTSLYK
jgi:cysteine synthase A